MAKQIINVGARNNDGTGDSLRVGATKVNDNFSEIYNLLGDGENLSVVSRINAGQGIAVSNSTGVVLITGRIASANDLGVIKVGENLTISPDGTLSAQQTVYSLPTASSTVLGGVKVGTGLSISQGVISSNNPTPYTLPIATSSIRGGVKIGANISVSPDGTISGNPDYLLPTATDSILGGIKIGAGLSISQGVVSVTSTGGSSDRLTNGLNEVVLGADGNLTLPASGDINIPNGRANVTGTATTVGGGATVGVRSILAIDSAFGSNDANAPASAQAIRGRVTGSNLTKTRNYVAGVTGQYLVTGTNASEFINTGLLGVVGDQTTTANAAVVAYLDGDGGLTTASSAYGVSMKNSTPGSGFDYGLDLQFIDLNLAGTTAPFKQADIRFNNGAVQRDTGTVQCLGNASTVVYTASGQYQHTIKLLIQVEGYVGAPGSWDTQACEMIIAKSFRGPTVAATVYAVVHTSVAPLATFTAEWNALTNRVEVLCATPSANTVNVRIFATEIYTAD